MSEKLNEPEADGGEPLALSDQEKHDLEKVAEVSKNARTTWFGLIALVLFCGVTLLGVEDRDFFEYGVSTQLPILNVSVPTTSFFWAAPILVTGLYTYLHLYLDKLWTALRRLKDTVGGRPVIEEVYPWLISDTALGMRGPEGERGRYWLLTRAISFCLGWLVGPLILYLFWTKSWAPHDEALTTWIGVQLVWVSAIGVSSWFGMVRAMPGREGLWGMMTAPGIAYFAAIVLIVVVAIGYGRTESGKFGGLYAADLYRANFTKPDKDWKGRDAAWLAYLRENPNEENHSKLRYAFDAEREWQRKNLERDNSDTGDFREADLSEAFMVGIEFDSANFAHADLSEAVLEGAFLGKAIFLGADLSGASLEDAILTDSILSDADLERARLGRADLTGSTIDRASFVNAKLDDSMLRMITSSKVYEGEDRTNFSNAKLNRADFRDSKLIGVDFTQSELSFANFRKAVLSKSTFVNAEIENANFTYGNLAYSNFMGANLEAAEFRFANLSSAILNYANFESAGLQSANLNLADITGANFWKANVEFASVIGSNLSNVRDLSQNHLDMVFGDISTVLDDDEIRPAHWPSVPIPQEQWTACWREWAISRGASSWELPKTDVECTTHADSK